MAIAAGRAAFRLGRLAFKYRKQIYRVLSAQDRYVDRAMRYGRFSKATRYGVRHGLTAGTIVGTILPGLDSETNIEPYTPPIGGRNGKKQTTYNKKDSRKFRRSSGGYAKR